MSKISFPTFNAMLEGRAIKNGRFPVCLVVYYYGSKRRYRIGIELSQEEWKKLHSPKLRDTSLIETKDKIQDFISTARDVAKDMNEFDFTRFETDYFGPKKNKKGSRSLKQVMQEYFDEEKNQTLRLKTKELFDVAVTAVEKYKVGVKINEITPDFLCGFESHLKGKDRQITTVNIYMRQIRTLVNYAIDQKGYLSRDAFPFKMYIIPSVERNHQALDDGKIRALVDYSSPDEKHVKARDFWIFSYLGNGINFNDIAKLRYSDINGEFLTFIRTKTIRQKRQNLKEISIYLQPKMLEIISKYGTNKGEKDQYIFPILMEKMTEKEENYAVYNFIKTTNKFLDRISTELGFPVPITTYWARHSYATKLQRSGAAVLEIKEGLGHSRVSTTENYLSRFQAATTKKNANLLLDLETEKR